MVASRAKVSFYLPMRGMGVFWLQEGRGCLSTYRRGSREFFGCRQDKGVSLPTAAEGWSFLVAGGAKVSFYLPPKEQGVFLLRVGERCLSTYHRGGWSFLVARGARVSSFLPPWGGMEFFGCRQSEGVSLPTTEGQEQKNAHPAGGMGGGGLLRAYNWSAADTIRTHLDGETNSPYPKPYNTPY